MGQPSSARQALTRVRPHAGQVSQLVTAMPDCYCCWVSGHYSSPMVPGQGGIHDALLFMTGGISGLRADVSVNVPTGGYVSPSSVPAGFWPALDGGGWHGRGRQACSSALIRRSDG